MHFSAIGTFTFFLFFAANAAFGRDLPLDKIKLPPGFKISLYADDVPGARSMALSSDGTLFVGTRGSKVYALPNRKQNKKADEVIVLADNLDTPNGVAFRDGALMWRR